MNAGYAGGEGGARAAARARSAVVVVDAFRASTTVAVLVSKGARVVPVASIEEARSYPGADLRAGERGSAKVRGFDFGNSPTEILGSHVPPGATVVLSTTNGTRVVEAAAGAPAVLMGAFVNAGALAKELASGRFGAGVVVVGCGWEGRRSSEDEAAAGAILHRLSGLGASLDGRAERVVDGYLERPKTVLRGNVAARRLARLGYEADVDLCLSEDALPTVPRLVDGAFAGVKKLRRRGPPNLRPGGQPRNRKIVLTGKRGAFTLGSARADQTLQSPPNGPREGGEDK